MMTQKPTPARQRPLALHVPAVDPRAKGKMMTPEDVIAIHPPRKAGQKPSRYTIIHTFLPEKKHKTGRAVWWWEVDVMAYFDNSLAQAAS
jgi:hypothetical protein